MSDSVSIVWFRLDLRLADNLSLLEAVTNSDYAVPVYIWSPSEDGHWAPGGASKWWLHQSLESLGEHLVNAESKLIIRSGDSLKVLQELIEETGAKSLFFNRRFDPFGRKVDENVEKVLESQGVSVKTFNSSLLHDPEKVRTKQGTPFKVFTPFWNHFTATIEPEMPAGQPKKIPFPKVKIKSLALDELELEPKIDWASGFRETFTPGENGAHKRLKAFLKDGIENYGIGRDLPNEDGVSMLSPHMHFGEIGPRQIWHAVRELDVKPTKRTHIETYLKEIGWRDFAHHVLYHFPFTSDKPLRQQYSKFPWSGSKEQLESWQKGMTGYPIVDAGMRQLWHTGWMHNRVRMIVASFLTKDLLISWKDGAEWFWDTLVDADLASNTLGWQWAGGCGADAAPYFRIFNPQLQGEKFDPHGEYVRRWVPELKNLESKWIHNPAKAPPLVLAAAGIQLGENYPKPLVDHDIARKRALAALAQVKVDRGDENEE
jgi:deoxyribodipyrimidine photo-lyase